MAKMFRFILSIIAISTATMASASSRRHPLEPLSASELTAVRAAVLASPAVPARPLQFHYVGLDEPDKPDILSYDASSGTTTTTSSSPTTLPRRAFVIAHAAGQSHELIVDVTNVSAPSVVSHAIHHGPGFPMLTSQDQSAASALLPLYRPFLESIRRRGLNASDVGCGLFSMGWFGDNERSYGGGRLAKMQCFVRHVDGDITTTANVFARPLDGVTLVVDLDRVAIVGYKDRVVEPVPKAEGTDYRAENLGPPFTGPATVPGVVVQPEGSGIRVDGHLVRQKGPLKIGAASKPDWPFKVNSTGELRQTAEWQLHEVSKCLVYGGSFLFFCAMCMEDLYMPHMPLSNLGYVGIH